jgi:transcriptional regulator with PAS, ATPase and Fis domain
MMEDHTWVKEFPGSIVVCDAEGIIVHMNDEAVKVFQKQGGEKLIGTNVFDCHPDSAKAKIEQIIETRKANVYTIEKNGAKKLIYQTPLYKDGKFSGTVELALEIPFEMPHFVRTA